MLTEETSSGEGPDGDMRCDIGISLPQRGRALPD
jgi:hypothetical protein